MDKKLFDILIESAEQMGEITRKENSMNTDKLRELLAKAEANSPVVDSGVMLSRESARAISIELDRLTGELAEARRDGERLDYLSHHGVSIRQEPNGPQHWYLVAPYHMGNRCVDNHERFVSPRAAIDAAIAAQEGK